MLKNFEEFESRSSKTPEHLKETLTQTSELFGGHKWSPKENVSIYLIWHEMSKVEKTREQKLKNEGREQYTVHIMQNRAMF